MILNKIEFFLIDNPIRRIIQKRYEIPILLKMTDRREFKHALEIGCGNGSGTALIKQEFRVDRITAVDLDERMIHKARKSTHDQTINFKVMDASKLDYDDNSFDVIFDFGIIHHIPNWRDCIRELRRVCKHAGHLFLEELAIETFSGFPGIVWRKTLQHPYEQMFEFKELEESLTENGFKIVAKRHHNPLRTLRMISLVARLNKK